MPTDYEIPVGRAHTPLVLGLDVGSTASRGMLFDITGHPLRPRIKVPHRFTTAPDGTRSLIPTRSSPN